MFYSVLHKYRGMLSIDQIESSVKDRICEDPCYNSADEATHSLLMLVAAVYPHLLKIVERIERNIFNKRATAAAAPEIKQKLQFLVHNISDCIQVFPENKKMWQISHIAHILLLRSDHAFADGHSEDCTRRSIRLSFKFVSQLVSLRDVEVNLGVVTVPCGKWKVLLNEIFRHMFFMELDVLQNHSSVVSTALYGEDDRMRRLMRVSRCLLGDYNDSSLELIDDIDRECRFFPPCMATLHQILRRTHRLSFDSRIEYTLFLKDARVSYESNLNFWKSEFSQAADGALCVHDWEEKKDRYIYQIKHMYGQAGGAFDKKSHSCEKFIDRVSPKMNFCCPFTLPKSEILAGLPDALKSHGNSICELASANPRDACARYLSLQKNVQVQSIMRPIQFYQLAKGLLSDIVKGQSRNMSGMQGCRFLKQGRNNGGRSMSETTHAPPALRCYSGSETDMSTSTENLSLEQRYVIRHTERQEPQGQENLPSSNRSSLDASTCSYNTMIIHHDDSDSKRGSRVVEPGRSITDIPDDFLSQSQVLKHLAKEAKTTVQCDEAPTPQWRAKNLRRSKLSKSKSQPDLRSANLPNQTGSTLINPRRTRAAKDAVIEQLQDENARLLLELEALTQKLSKTEKLEYELNKVHRAQEELAECSERRGRLERDARTRLQEMNRALRDQVELLSAQALTTRVPTGDALRRELNNRDILITQLIASNKELTACKERQEIELAAQRQTLQEQRTHIDILDTALTNAQGNVVRLEEECRKKQMFVELVPQLKQALATQMQASERREQTEQMLRLQLERELRAERGKSTASDSASGSTKRYGSGASGSGVGDGNLNEYPAELKRKLREREERIMMLEAENAKWEQRYIEESALRQAAIEAASLPKDAKIAALEKTSQDTERLILEARTEKMRHMDEQHAAQKRVADLQAQVKHLESRLAERDAMIKVLQKHTYDKGFTDLSRQEIGGSASVFSNVTSALTSSTGFTSLTSSDSSNKLFYSSAYHPATSVSDSAKLSYHGGDASSKLSYGGDSTSKLSFSGESTPNYGSFRGQYSTGQSFDDSKKTLDDQLKELDSQLDSQLLSKRGLCCFPGFSNPSTSPRKGKISQPLLASVAGLGGLVRSEPPTRPEEMMLLEKQGRSSQRQRAGSLPPSSLPRPRRSRKLGEYGRLSDSEAARKTSTDESFAQDHRHQLSEFNRFSETSKNDDMQLPPASPTSFSSFGRLKTPPIENRKIDYSSRTASALTKLEFPNYPRLKTPPYDGSFPRKRGKETSPSVSSTISQFGGTGRFKTPPPADVSKIERATPPPNLDLSRCTPSPKLDLSRCTPPKASIGSAKKSFIPPPRKLGDYSRFGGRSSSESSSATPQNSTDNTPNYRIRF